MQLTFNWQFSASGYFPVFKGPISVGLAVYPVDGVTGVDLVDAANRQLYRKKRIAGREGPAE
jgi:hypothetical protein